MEDNAMVSCSPLPVFSFHENLEVSSLSHAVGSVVKFKCTDSKDKILSGPSVLLCNTAGKWNGTFPTCVDKDGLTSSVTSDTTESLVSTTPVSEGELEVETVLIVLWVTGGLLLVTLVVLMACILRSHKKQQRNRSERHPRAQGNPRHGGVNPTFSTYDEIWTWIPVLTDNADQCRNQANASTRENNADRTNNELTRNLRLPTYSEAVSSTTPVASSSQPPVGLHSVTSSNQRQTVSQRQNMIQSNTQRPPQTNVLESRNQGATRSAQVHRTVVNIRESRGNSHVSRSDRGQTRENGNTNIGSNEQHHYETIPADAITQPNVASNYEHAGRMNATTSSVSALQEARNLVNQFSAHAQRPQPSAPEYVHVSHDYRREQHNAVPRTYIHQSSASSRSQQTRSQNSHRFTANHSSHEFRHSEGSRFEYYVDNGRRTRNRVISEPPPPYTAVREASSEARGYSSRMMASGTSHGMMASGTSSGIMASGTSPALAAASLRTGLECQYF